MIDQSNFDGSATSIREVFESVARAQTDSRSGYARTLEKLSEQVLKLQNAGVTNIGMEVADFDTLQAYQMVATRPDHLFAIISVYDARFIARIDPEYSVTLHMKNINKIHTNLNELKDVKISQKLAKLKMTTRLLDDSDVFSAKVEQPSVTYDLSDAGSVNDLLYTLTETAATCEAAYNLRKNNITPNSIFK